MTPSSRLFASALLVCLAAVETEGLAAEPDTAAEAKPTGKSRRALELENGLDGSSGLLRSVAADSGDVGTFRVSLTQTYFTGSGFLCGACALPGSAAMGGSDDVSQVGTHLGVSATPARFLEAYAGLEYQSTSNSRGSPHAIQLVGDSLFGLKAFTPRSAGNILLGGAAVDARFISTPNGVGVDTASVDLRALGTLDLTRREREEDRIPLRVHGNLGYLFDGSSKLADDTESSRAGVLGPNRISRIERFGHRINRVDTLRPVLGLEGVFPYVRPFAEWGIDVPVNRQGHSCAPPGVRSPGDGCLSDAGFSGIASRLTLGARVYPWVKDWLEGLALLAAVDIGTGATSAFVEEIAPERPWAIHIGAAWAVDTSAREKVVTVQKVVEQAATRPEAAPERHIEGTVGRAGTAEPVPGAVLHFTGRPLSAIVADEQGRFRTANLDAGDYRFAITRDGFKDGECTAVVPETAGGLEGGAAAGAPAAPRPTSRRPVVVNLQCSLEALPRVATITGTVRDADTTEFIEGATVTITDPLGRTLSLRTDAQGAFRFGNVLEGKSKLGIEQEHYLRGAEEIDLEARKDVTEQILLHPRPKAPNVIVTKKELKLKKEVHFLHGSAELQADSAALIEEAAEVLREHTEIAHLEVQGHTDDTGGADFNLKLSEARANAVRSALVSHGVEASRLTARGYGQEKPLVPNSSARNRAKNRRVQLVIVP